MAKFDMDFLYLYPHVLHQRQIHDCIFSVLNTYQGIRCTNGQFFMSGKVLKTIYFLTGNNVDNSNLILLGLEKKGK